ncbi:MAG: DUF4173 domain-containing protein [Bacteroidales bacterium]|jgi:hypothetical protein|nr:DUF4173 domain-containing protein [Bacteroidales bacterium]
MKKHQLIFLTTAIFTILFYEQSIGLNLGILGLILTVLVYVTSNRIVMNKTFYTLVAASIGSSVAFAWYGDLASFFAVFVSLSLLVFRSRAANLKPIFMLIVIPLNALASLFRIFMFDKWLPKSQKNAGVWKKLFAYLLIPLVFVIIFFAVYASGSEHFANFIAQWEWNINIGNLICMALLGLYLMFCFWNFAAGDSLEKRSRLCSNDFKKTPNTEKSTFSFMDIQMERTSGIISFVCLNVLLLIFVITFNYEQFFETQNGGNLSAETHERVNTVIFSIVMAIGLIMFYFRGGFNFDTKAKGLKILAKIWIVLNAALVFSAFAKNTEYIYETDLLTYKRLGVYAFLILSLIGLIYTFIKIQKRKTNAFLCNKMFWYFFGTLLTCSFINWGGIITRYNMSKENFDIDYHVEKIDFNYKLLLQYAEGKGYKSDVSNIHRRLYNEYLYGNEHLQFLSKKLYYETLPVDLNKIKLECFIGETEVEEADLD